MTWDRLMRSRSLGPRHHFNLYVARLRVPRNTPYMQRCAQIHDLHRFTPLHPNLCSGRIETST